MSLIGDTKAYSPTTLSRQDVEALEGRIVLDFGTSWCGVCRASAAMITQALAAHPRVRHLAIEDGPGRALGRAYRVKLWPTLVFLRDGSEIERLVRPRDVQSIIQALARLDGA